MSKQEHTPEPWRMSGPDVFGDYTINTDDVPLAIAAVANGETRRLLGREAEHTANARRICAAVNATAGISTESLEDGVIAEMREALEKSAEGWANALELDIIIKQHRTTAKILRDEARAVLAKLNNGDLR